MSRETAGELVGPDTPIRWLMNFDLTRSEAEGIHSALTDAATARERERCAGVAEEDAERLSGRSGRRIAASIRATPGGEGGGA